MWPDRKLPKTRFVMSWLNYNHCVIAYSVILVHLPFSYVDKSIKVDEHAKTFGNRPQNFISNMCILWFRSFIFMSSNVIT